MNLGHVILGFLKNCDLEIFNFNLKGFSKFGALFFFVIECTNCLL